jgi:hypothetical protein
MFRLHAAIFRWLFPLYIVLLHGSCCFCNANFLFWLLWIHVVPMWTYLILNVNLDSFNDVLHLHDETTETQARSQSLHLTSNALCFDNELGQIGYVAKRSQTKYLSERNFCFFVTNFFFLSQIKYTIQLASDTSRLVGLLLQSFSKHGQARSIYTSLNGQQDWLLKLTALIWEDCKLYNRTYSM